MLLSGSQSIPSSSAILIVTNGDLKLRIDVKGNVNLSRYVGSGYLIDAQVGNSLNSRSLRVEYLRASNVTIKNGGLLRGWGSDITLMNVNIAGLKVVRGDPRKNVYTSDAVIYL